MSDVNERLDRLNQDELKTLCRAAAKIANDYKAERDDLQRRVAELKKALHEKGWLVGESDDE